MIKIGRLGVIRAREHPFRLFPVRIFSNSQYTLYAWLWFTIGWHASNIACN